jgi:uncharacterized membrane protein HdeD (DUF308 family)
MPILESNHSRDPDVARIDSMAGPIATWCLVLGGVLAVLGGLALASPWAASTVIDVFCGVTLIAAGISQLAMTAGTLTYRGFWLTLVCGALSIMAGTGMLVLPEAGIDAMVVFLGLALLFESVAKLAAAFSIRKDFPWGWLLFDGMVTGLLGGILLTTKPAEAGILLGIFVGINLISSGATFAGAGWWMRRAEKLASSHA